MKTHQYTSRRAVIYNGHTASLAVVVLIFFFCADEPADRYDDFSILFVVGRGFRSVRQIRCFRPRFFWIFLFCPSPGISSQVIGEARAFGTTRSNDCERTIRKKTKNTHDREYNSVISRIRRSADELGVRVSAVRSFFVLALLFTIRVSIDRSFRSSRARPGGRLYRLPAAAVGTRESRPDDFGYFEFVLIS